jgi:hypothetical protein
MNPKCLGQGVEVLVVVLKTCEAATDRQWSSISRHLQLEVRIMGNCHKPGERWAPKDGVVLGGLVDYFELNLLLSIVCRSAEDDIHVYNP